MVVCGVDSDLFKGSFLADGNHVVLVVLCELNGSSSTAYYFNADNIAVVVDLSVDVVVDLNISVPDLLEEVIEPVLNFS